MEVFDNSYSTSQALLITKANSTELKFFMDSYHWQAKQMLEAPYNLKFMLFLESIKTGFHFVKAGTTSNTVHEWLHFMFR